MRKTEKIIDCLSRLEKLISAVNYLPLDETTAQNIDRIAKQANQTEFEDFSARALLESKINSLRIPEEVLDYLLAGSFGLVSISNSSQRWSELVQARQILFGIAQINRDEIIQHGDNFKIEGVNRMARVYEFTDKITPLRYDGALILDAKGFPRPQSTGLIKIFADCDIELERIKFCDVCNRIFWASRLNTKHCSKKCSNIYHQKLLRSSLEKLNRVNEQRKKNYEYKKKGRVK